VDLTQGGFWPFHPAAQVYPALYHYTFPHHPFFGDAILGGVPFWCGGFANPAVVLERRHRAFFAHSRYMDTVGLTVEIQTENTAPRQPCDDRQIASTGTSGTNAAAAALRWDGPHGWVAIASGRNVGAVWHLGENDLVIVLQNDGDAAATATVTLNWEGLRGKRLEMGEGLDGTPLADVAVAGDRLAFGMRLEAHGLTGAYCRLAPLDGLC
jgi:hypothetical protein